jgi:S-DNA-T family DNA segregation ATPase FtsK/SpoIIIE
MKLKLTYRRASGAAAEIVVVADASASVGAVARHLLDVDPAGPRYAGPGEDVTLAVAAPGGQPIPLPPDRAIGEAPLASGFDVRVVQAGTGEANRTAAATLRIEAGPAEGKEYTLLAGSTVVGRGRGTGIMIPDSFMSKQHARIEVTPSENGTTIEVIDLNSANGIMLDGAVISRAKALPGQRFELGNTSISLTPLSRAGSGGGRSIQGGAIGFTRSPRVEERYPAVEHPRP